MLSNDAGQRASDAQVRRARNGAGLGQTGAEIQPDSAEARATLIAQLIETGRENSFAIRQRMRIRQATLSHIARAFFGYHTGLTEVERKKAMDGATKAIKSIRSGEEHPAADVVLATDGACEPWEAIELATEKAMVKLARQLPAYDWVEQVRGFGALSFARIIAETGDLSNYDGPAKVWKRLGLAVFGDRAQRRTRDAEKAVEQGYSPRRRSVSWVTFHSVCLAQSARKDPGGQCWIEAQPSSASGNGSDHDAADAHTSDVAAAANGAGHKKSETHRCCAGPYRQLYDRKKAEYLARVEAGEEGWNKLRADRAAKRYSEKRLIRDLWVAWRAA